MADSAAIKAAMAAMMKRNSETPNSGDRPPNLTVTEDQRVNCSTCVHWDGQGTCRMYSYRTQPDQICDSWAPEPT